MTRVRVKGFQIFKDRHGRVRCYHRATRIKIDLVAHPLGSAEFFAECQKIAAHATAQASMEPKPGTLGGLILFYFQSDQFRGLADRTKADYRRCADFLAPIADTPVFKIDTPLVSKIHDRAGQKLGWRRANYVRTFLSEVFKQCIPRGPIEQNFATAVLVKKRPKDAPYSNRPWAEDERQAALAGAGAHLRAAIALMASTGLDPSDAIRLTRAQISGGVIRGVRDKTGEEVNIPILGTLRTALSDAPPHDAITVLATSRGTPWTYSGLSTVWHRYKARLEACGAIQPGLTLKGLRHTVATTLREGGVDPRDIADLLGQKTTSMALHYSRAANLGSKNLKTAQKLERENEKRRKIVKPSPKSVKP